MLAILLVVRASQGNPEPAPAAAVSAGLIPFEVAAELRLEDGWSPRFSGAQDPDQPLPWPVEGGFGLPWEPASPYLGDQGVALNGPKGMSEVALWRGLEWRRTRFDAPLASARLMGSRLLVTLRLAPDRFETRLLEVPEGRVIWSVRSGPWSRFSWDGKAVLVGLTERDPREKTLQRLLLSVLPVDTEPGETSLAPWDEKGLSSPPRGWPLLADRLSEDQRDLPGHRLLLPWTPGSRLGLPAKDLLWWGAEGRWSLWRIRDGAWRREAEGEGSLLPQPPVAMGLVRREGEEVRRFRSSAEEAAFEPLGVEPEPWPAPDPAWTWTKEGAFTAWDLRWGTLPEDFGAERQREQVRQAFRADWNLAKGQRASVRGWLPQGPEVALREREAAAWCWVGDRIILTRLAETARVRRLRKMVG